MGLNHAQRCRLCDAPRIEAVGEVAGRRLFRCDTCDLVFVAAAQHLTRAQERARYAQHDNRADNPGYVAYLEGVADLLNTVPCCHPRVLDFGCGAEAVLTRVLRARGVDCVAYDPLYAIGSEALDASFDVVMAIEVLEHLRDLPSELALLRRLVRPGGFLVVRTRFRLCAPQAVRRWWYAHDPTHIDFFSPPTLDWLARWWGMPVYHRDGVQTVVFGPKPVGSGPT